jgi:hypothetical protein
MTLIGGAHLSVTEREKGERIGPRVEARLGALWAEWGAWAVWGKEEKERRREERAGLGWLCRERERERDKDFYFFQKGCYIS